MDEFFEMLSFPYSSVRAGQDEFIKRVYKTLLQNRNIMISAPTGLGKTVSGLAPAIYVAKQKNLTVICLTSRQTQANQIIRTIKDINNFSKGKGVDEKSEKSINYMAFIGKRSMCVHPERDLYPAQDFNDFCKKMRETGKCKFFKNSKNTEYEEQIKAIIGESSDSFMSVEGFVNFAGSNNFCPYELAGKKAFHADVVICDYNYLFSEGIREGFLGKLGRNLEECIVIVDEAHNLPDRVRGSYSFVLSSELVKNALKELNDFVKSDEFDVFVSNIRSVMEEIYFDKVLDEKTEYLLSKKEFVGLYMGKFNSEISFASIVGKLREVEALVKEERVVSFVGRVANFLESWLDLDEKSFLRVLEKNVKEDKTALSLRIRCIDPSEIVSEVLNCTYSSILMSGTLSPIAMYKDILGIANTDMLELESPFLKENQLTLVIDDVTSKYSARDIIMYKRIAKHIGTLLGSAFGKNAIVFFPSYDFMDKVLSNLDVVRLQRKVFKEQRYMTKEQKEEFVDKFRESGSFDDKAKVLFAVTSGSFAEGLDLPNEALEMVVVVGLPLSVPDTYTQAVIRHYEGKFRKGQLYGYIFPAMSKIIQAAGRCIRTEEDRGVVVLMDNRFFWPLYAQTFPKHWHLKRSSDDYGIEIGNFYN